MSVKTQEQRAIDELRAFKDHAVRWAHELEEFAEHKASAMASERLMLEISGRVRAGIQRIAQDIREKL